MAFSGTLVQGGDGEVLVCYIGMNTQIGRIVQLTKETESVMTPIRRELQRFITIISAIAIFLGILFFIISIATKKGAMSSLVFAIGIIVANVPEGLLPTVTLALTMASKRMSKKNALIKNLEVRYFNRVWSVPCIIHADVLIHQLLLLRRVLRHWAPLQ